ncbi:MAG: hypothetical protein KY457_09740 [Actinobacteria bacterium]|nr:hypothetical protein [Actinomycetota bacterium]
MTETLLQELLDRGFLFDDPATYRAGVVDAWAAIREAAGAGDVTDRTAVA